MPAENTPAVVPPVNEAKQQVGETVKEVTFHHEPNQVNIYNNRGFALFNGEVVEVVRRSLENNSKEMELVNSADLRGYTHPVMDR